MTQIKQYDIERAILEELKTNEDPRIGRFKWYFSEEIYKKFPEDKLEEVKQKYLPALMHLIGEGLIYLDFTQGNMDNNTLHFTEYGEEYVDNQEITPSDNVGYIKYLEDNINNFDDVAKQYLIESIKAYRAKCYLSSIFCLGASSEKIVLLLRDEYCKALDSGNYFPRKTNLEGMQKIKQIYEALKQDFLKIHNTDNQYFGNTLKEKIETQITHLFQFFRISRNEIGHPLKISGVDQFDANGNLMLFPRYCITIYEIINILNTKALPSNLVF